MKLLGVGEGWERKGELPGLFFSSFVASSCLVSPLRELTSCRVVFHPQYSANPISPSVPSLPTVLQL